MADAPYDAVDVVVGLARTARAAGVAADPSRVQTAVEAMATLDAGRRDDVYWAGRLALCGGRDDIARYDRAFAAYFGDRVGAPARRTAAPTARLQVVAEPTADGSEPGAGDETAPLTASASTVEVLRHRDIASLTATEKEILDRLLTAFRLPGETRRLRRHRAAARGPVDRPRTVRALLDNGGEPARLHRRTRREEPRRVVLLLDVSGSMSAYADALLRFAHAAEQGARRDVEVFTVGTRLTRVTRELGHRDPETALRAVARAVPDWSGGTRLGELVKRFLDVWGQRGMARGAVVVVLSDGWERGDPALLARQLARLRRLAHRVVWCNPLKARPGYAPLAAGMAAALPHVDDFVEGHSLAALEHLAAVVAGARDA